MIKEFYYVHAYRYGDKESYNFPVGIFETEEQAVNEAKLHRQYRGGKYGHLVYKLPVGKAFDASECEPIMEMLN